ncbi:putative secologanin synthase [Senna tora]|uniref:Putative secologanin synthase n=1 Tax=Senna tora TaxID=362788 RepID=A0A834X2W3_9FABA|nr:putative secologanin synthase [Senna tora]
MMMMMLVVLVKTVNWVWLKPKKMERFLRQQGLKGNSYNFLFGDFKAFAVAAHQANSKPMHLTLTHDIAPRVLPFFDLILKTYGKDSFIWFGPTPSLNIMNPENIKTVLTNMGDFSKRRENPLTSYLLTGVFTMENQKWAKHRKIINPAFHLEKLKVLYFIF